MSKLLNYSICFFLIILSIHSIVHLPFPKGIRQPKRYYGRYRRIEYDRNLPFYQWWYYWIFDEESNNSFAVTYLVSSCSSKSDNIEDVKNCSGVTEGSYVNFALMAGRNDDYGVRKMGRSNFQIMYKFPIERFENLDKESIDFTINGTSFMVRCLNDDEFYIYGKIKGGNENLWIIDGDIKENEIVEWNITIRRRFGWYGEHIVEEIFEWLKTGVIMWNTYGHTSFVVEGFIRIGDQFVNLKSNQSSYCDSNWGTKLPISPSNDDQDFSWGWYIAKDQKQNFMFVCGVGQIYTGGDELGIVGAKYCDIIGLKDELNLRHAFIRKGEPVELQAESSTDGRCYSYEVNRKNWVDFEDKFGKAQIPLTQILNIETELYQIEATFSSRIENYNRLLFPFNGVVFSDFEGLGATADIVVKDKTSGEIVKQMNVHNAGMEFGYKYDVNILT